MWYAGSMACVPLFQFTTEIIRSDGIPLADTATAVITSNNMQFDDSGAQISIISALVIFSSLICGLNCTMQST